MSAPFYLADIGEVIMEWHRVNDRGGVGQRPVYRVECGDCSTVLSDRCMRAALLSDKKTVIYSTDMQPTTVGYIYGDYSAPCCGCRLRDIACIACGKELGYNITFPCTECLSSENNSHYWMFRECNVTSKQILFEAAYDLHIPLPWAFVCSPSNYGGENYIGDYIEAAKRSCELSVILPSFVPLCIRNPRMMYIEGQTRDSIKYDSVNIEYIR